MSNPVVDTPTRDSGPSGERPESTPSRRRVEAVRGTLADFMRSQPMGTISLALIAVFVLMAALAPLFAPYDPLQQHRNQLLAPPSGQFLLGTDDLGRDVLSRVIYGARTSLLIGVVTIGVSLALGTVLGVVSGFIGKSADIGVQRLMDAIVAIPPIVLLLFIATALGPALRNVIIALILVIVPGFNRVARGETLRLRGETYIEAARATGTGALRIMRRHILPNMVAPMLTVATVAFAAVIIAESALSFLGLGTPPPTPSWGTMLSDGLSYVTRAPWLVIVPAAALSLAVFAFNLLGDALRDHLDPKMQQ